MDETTALGAEALLATEVSERIAIESHALHELHSRAERTKRLGVAVLALGAAFAVIALGLFVYAQLNAPLKTFSDIMGIASPLMIQSKDHRRRSL